MRYDEQKASYGQWDAPRIPVLVEFERVTLTRLRLKEGMGVDGDPVRHVTYWIDDDGRMVQRDDPMVRAGESSGEEGEVA